MTVLEFLPGQIVRCIERHFADGNTGRAAIEQVECAGFKQPFIACYDYGQGGIWVLVRAESGASIRAKYPELSIIPRVPDWMTPEAMSSISARQTYDLDADATGFLATLVKERERA